MPAAAVKLVELAARVKAGDAVAVTAFRQAVRPRLLEAMPEQLPAPEQEDLVREVLRVFLYRAADGQPAGALEALAAILRERLAFNGWLADNPRPATVRPPAPPPAPEPAPVRDERPGCPLTADSESWAPAVATLPPQLREVLEAVLRGLTPGRAAPALGLTLREAWDRALAGLAAAKRAAGLPPACPELESALQDARLWPPDAGPLAVDIGAALRRLRDEQRDIAYGRLEGETTAAAAARIGCRSANVHQRGYAARDILACMATYLGALPANSDGPLAPGDVGRALGIGGISQDPVHMIAARAGVEWSNPSHGVGGYARADFRRFWDITEPDTGALPIAGGHIQLARAPSRVAPDPAVPAAAAAGNGWIAFDTPIRLRDGRSVLVRSERVGAGGQLLVTDGARHFLVDLAQVEGRPRYPIVVPAGLVEECDAAKAAGFPGNAHRRLLTLATSLGIPRIEVRPGVHAYVKEDLPRLAAARTAA